jgi:hypothetical protein
MKHESRKFINLLPAAADQKHTEAAWSRIEDYAVYLELRKVIRRLAATDKNNFTPLHYEMRYRWLP